MSLDNNNCSIDAEKIFFFNLLLWFKLRKSLKVRKWRSCSCFGTFSQFVLVLEEMCNPLKENGSVMVIFSSCSAVQRPEVLVQPCLVGDSEAVM